MTAGGHLSANGAASLPLRDWLAAHRRADAGARTLRVGACGHLLLTPAETRQVRRQLVERVLPALCADGATRLSLFVGMAPGADLVFLETATQWLRARKLPFELTALLPVPLGHLIGDWVLRAQDEHRQISREARRRLAARAEALLQNCTAMVPLYPDDIGAATLSSRAFRQSQYRRLAAILAQHADHVVAILRPDASAAPGGTAEIVAWRRAPSEIPAPLRLHPAHCAVEARLHLVDPGAGGAALSRAAAPIEEDELSRVLRLAEEARRDGNELSCSDIVYRALKSGLRSPQLDYLRIQSLANTGNARLALEHYHGLDFGDEELDEDWLALRGRLEKDLAIETGEPRHYARAARAYREAFDRHGGSYSAINAASMLLLAGRRGEARGLARATLRRLGAERPGNELERYYHLVTEAEAALLLGETARCRARLRAADRLLREDITRRSRTRQQLGRLCGRLGVDAALVETLRLPPVALLHGHGEGSGPALAGELPISLRRLAAARALLHLALCEPRDLETAERLARLGARLYLALPAPPPELLRYWRGGAAALAPRLQRLLDAADGVATLRGFLAGERRWAAAEAATVSRGLATLAAQRLGTPLRELACSAKPAPRRRAASASKAAADAAPAHRRMVGLIFTDFASFRRLRDPLFPRYYRDIMRGLAALLDRYAAHVLVRQTWGDAVHVVTDDAASAAHIVADIQHYIEQHRLQHEGVLADLELRIAAHHAPAYAGFDPIEDKPSYYGTQLSFAARIEPVVPPGMIYVTESFAARLALEAADAFLLDYAGEVELAKQFGAYRLYALRRRAAA